MKKLLFCKYFFFLIVNAQSINLKNLRPDLQLPSKSPNANDSRMFVVQQNGIIKIVQPNGTVNSNFLISVQKSLTEAKEGF
jgi:hypothetical protein